MAWSLPVMLYSQPRQSFPHGPTNEAARKDLFVCLRTFSGTLQWIESVTPVEGKGPLPYNCNVCMQRSSQDAALGGWTVGLWSLVIGGAGWFVSV